LQIAISAPVNVRALTPFLDSADAHVPRGLGSTATTPLIAELLKRGHEVSVFTLDSEVDRELSLSGPRLRIHIGPYRKSGRGRDFFKQEVGFLRRAIQRETPRVVHAHWTYEFALGALQSGSSTIVTIHDLPWCVLRYLPSFYRTARLSMALQVARSNAMFTAVSSDAAGHFQKYLFGRSPIQVVPNLLPLDVLEMGAGPLPLRQDDIVFASVLQGWTPAKNGSALLKAFQRVLNTLPNSRLLMIGAGYALGGSAHQWAKAKGLVTNVKFIGPLPHQDMLRYVQEQVDVLVHPSRHEALSITIMEAMAMAKPIIAGRRTPGQGFLLEEGRCGSLVNVEDPDAIAEAMIHLARHPEERERSAENARTSAWRRFHPDVVVPQYERIYAQFSSN
jgi:glycosyltransferase involved in cell wall biosynthesis